MLRVLIMGGSIGGGNSGRTLNGDGDGDGEGSCFHDDRKWDLLVVMKIMSYCIHDVHDAAFDTASARSI